MKTKIVYCLVSDRKDYYYEQLLISLCSLRKHNPDAEVEVFCDQETFTTFTGNRRGIFEYGIHVNSIKIPEDWKKLEKSRYLKTNLRKLTHGDYLYIDTDTIVCASLAFIDDYPFEIAAVYDSHLETPLPKLARCKFHSQRWIWGESRKLGANIEGMRHFNSGVMLVRDTPSVIELYTKWNEHYRQQLEYGVKIDQLPLLLSNAEMNNIIAPLDWNLNCQVPFYGIRSKVAEAKIIHYFPAHNTTLLSSSWIMDPIKETGRINVVVQRIIDEPYNFFDKESCVAVGNVATLVQSRSVQYANIHFPRIFCVFCNILENFYGINKKCKSLISRLFAVVK